MVYVSTALLHTVICISLAMILFSMTQPAFIDTIIKSIGLEDESKQRQTSPLSPPLHTHEELALFNEK